MDEQSAKSWDNEELIDFYLPEYLTHDIEALKDGAEKKVSHLDCLFDEVQGSINMAYYDHYISWEQAELLRKVYLLW